MTPVRSHPLVQGAILSAQIGTVYFLLLSFVFPGFFSPYWPVHADAYMFIPSAKHWLAENSPLLIPRPLGFVLEQYLHAYGLRTGLFLNALIPLVSIALTVQVARRWLSIERPHLVSLLSYLSCLIAHPGFYVAHTYDQFSNLEYFFAILGLFLWLVRPVGPVTHARLWLVCSLIFASAFCKEAYCLSLAALWGYLWFVERRDTPVLAPLLAALVGSAGSFVYMRLSGAVFTSGQQAYEVVATPQSVLDTLGAYLRPNLVWPIFLLLTGTYLLAWREGKFIRTLLLSVAGVLALIPYAMLPRHFASFYSWSAMPLFAAPMLLIGNAATAQFFPANGKCRAGFNRAFAFSAAGLVGLSLIAWQKYYSQQRWTLDRQQEQRLLLTGLKASNRTLLPGSRVLISGMNLIFHPFQWPAFASTLFPNASEIDFVTYSTGEQKLGRGDPSRTDGTKVRFIAPVQVTGELIARTNRVILFNETGQIVGEFSPPYSASLTAGALGPFPGNPLDCIRYPKLWESKSALETGADITPVLLALGATRYDPEYDPIAEAALQGAIAIIPDNPYPYFYLGTLKERRKELPQAQHWFVLARDVAARTGASNPVFDEGVKRTR